MLLHCRVVLLSLLNFSKSMYAPRVEKGTVRVIQPKPVWSLVHWQHRLIMVPDVEF